jgi:G:T/U-mismatch repair DNA glycosylase
MTAYAQELRRCQLVLILRAVLDAGGNQCAAARAAGLHRNTVWRVVREAGYTPEQLKRMARARARHAEMGAAQRKPPASEAMPRAEERRVA